MDGVDDDAFDDAIETLRTMWFTGAALASASGTGLLWPEAELASAILLFVRLSITRAILGFGSDSNGVVAAVEVDAVGDVGGDESDPEPAASDPLEEDHAPDELFDRGPEELEEAGAAAPGMIWNGGGGGKRLLITTAAIDGREVE